MTRNDNAHTVVGAGKAFERANASGSIPQRAAVTIKVTDPVVYLFPTRLLQLVRVSINKNWVGKPDEDANGRLTYSGKPVNTAKGWINVELPFIEVFDCITAKGYAVCAQLNGANGSKHGYRKAENFISHSLVLIDIDHGLTIEQVRADVAYTKYAAGYYVTASHTEARHRFRIIFRLERDITDPDEMRCLYNGLIKAFGGDPNCKDPARQFYGNPTDIKEYRDGVLTNESINKLIVSGRAIDLRGAGGPRSSGASPAIIPGIPPPALAAPCGDLDYQPGGKEIAEALTHISPDVDHDTWLKVGMSLHAASLGELGLELWDTWSRGSEKYKRDEPSKRWSSFKIKPNGITHRTLFDIANKSEKVPESELAPIRALMTNEGWVPAPPSEPALASLPREATKRVILVRGDTLRPELIHWVWNGWLARAMMHILAGAPGCGKSTIGLAIAATVTAGRDWPDGTPCARGDVLVWSGEDGTANTLLPRFLASGGDPKRVHFVRGVIGPEGPRYFDPALDLPELLTAARALPDLRYVLVDPVVSAITGDSHKNVEVRRSLQPLVEMAAELDVALLGISHFTKGTAGRDPVERVTGSLAFGALARVVLAAAKIQEDASEGESQSAWESQSERRIFCRAKSNIGPDDGGWEYSLVLTDVPGSPEIIVTKAQWGAPLEGSAKDLLATAEASTDSDKRDAITEAGVWLRSLLGAGPMTAKQIKTAAKKEGIAWRTIGRAKKGVGIKTCRTGFGKDGDWSWELPIGACRRSEASDAQIDIAVAEILTHTKELD